MVTTAAHEHCPSIPPTSPQSISQRTVTTPTTNWHLLHLQDTVSAVIAASRLPLSIMIVGVGSADFSAMRRLDSDGKLLRDRTGIAERDIVQV